MSDYFYPLTVLFYRWCLEQDSLPAGTHDALYGLEDEENQ